MQAFFSFARTLGLSLLLGGASLAALAGDGHDHGEAPAAPSGPAMPRFAATSDLFELVGVLDGAQLSLYLDHSADNRPVADAQLELDLASPAVYSDKNKFLQTETAYKANADDLKKTNAEYEIVFEKLVELEDKA